VSDDVTRVLLVEDNPADARLIEMLLGEVRWRRFRLERAETLAEAFRRLESNRFEAILLDLSLPDSLGLPTLESVHARVPELPIVVMTGLDDDDVALRGVHEGAQDYLVKGRVNGELVARSILYAVERRRTEKAQREAKERDRFRRIFEGSFDAIAIAELPEGRLVDVNEEFVALLGRSRDAVLGRTPAELGFRRIDAAASSTRNVEMEFHRRDGVRGSALVSLLPIDLGGRRSLIWFVRDVTAERAASEVLQRLSGRLLRLQDEERRRIARELHDSAGPNLVAVSIELASLKESIEGLDAGAKSSLEGSIALVKQCLREIRTLSYLLHPPLLDEGGLRSAIRWFCDGFAERSGVGIELSISDDFGRLDRDQEIALFRIVQEGLNNVHRHSGSPTARIRLRRDPTAVVLEIEDEGRGLSRELTEGAPDAVAGLGVGIPGMRERIRQLGGWLEIRSNGMGTVVKATLPSKPASDA
jgi:PAS domain S-box-containing protein